MKKLLVLLAVLIFCAVSVSASALAEGGTVTAVGSGSVTLVPDMATFSIGITTQDVLITTAQNANATAMQAVIDALTALGVAREDIQTEYYSVYPMYDYSDSTPVVTSHEVSNTVTVIVRALDTVPSLLDAAVEAGANNIYSLNFQSSEWNAAYDQALKAAVQDAQRKAALIAQAVGRETGDPLSLTESTSTSAVYAKSFALALDSSMPVPIENGTITVTAEVTVVVEMK